MYNRFYPYNFYSTRPISTLSSNWSTWQFKHEKMSTDWKRLERSNFWQSFEYINCFFKYHVIKNTHIIFYWWFALYRANKLFCTISKWPFKVFLRDVPNFWKENDLLVIYKTTICHILRCHNSVWKGFFYFFWSIDANLLLGVYKIIKEFAIFMLFSLTPKDTSMSR